MAEQSTAVATTDRRGITALLKADDARAKIVPMLRGVDYDRVVGEVYLVTAENPEILKCTPASIIRAVARAVSWGLEIGQTVHLVPFNVKVSAKGETDRWEKRLTAIRDYKGDIELIIGAGAARSIRTQAVYENEVFEYVEGTEPILRHLPARNAKDRGEMIGAYAIADHGYNRPPHVKYMPIADIDAIRQKFSKQWKVGPCPPWYACKTAVKQLAKTLPKNVRLAKVLAMFEQEETDVVDVEQPALPGQPVTTVEAPRGQPALAQQVDNREPGEEDGEEFLDDRDIA
jgi:phage RecT family recombinase